MNVIPSLNRFGKSFSPSLTTSSSTKASTVPWYVNHSHLSSSEQKKFAQLDQFQKEIDEKYLQKNAELKSDSSFAKDVDKLLTMLSNLHPALERLDNHS